MQTMRRHPTALVVAGCSALLAGAGLVTTIWLDLHTDPTGPGATLVRGWGWSYALLGALLTGLAATIVLRRPGQGFGYGLAWCGLFWSLDAVGQSYARFAIRPDDALALTNLALWDFNRLGSFLPLTGALLLMLFPTGRFLPGRWRLASWTATGAMALAASLVVLAPIGTPRGVALPRGVDLDAGALPLPDRFDTVALPLCTLASVAGLLVAMATVVVRYRRSQGIERDSMRWLLWGVVVIALVLALSAGIEVQALNDAAIFVIMLVPAVAMTVGILAPTVVAIDDLLARTVVYAALTAVVVGVDLAAVALLGRLVGDALTSRQVVLAALLVSVLVYAPLRLRLARLVQRVLLGRRAERYDVVAGLASALEATGEGPEQLGAVARAVAEAFGVRYVGVEIERSAGERLLASFGTRPQRIRSLPISYRGERVGVLLLPATGLRSRLSARDEQLLTDLVRQAATAARAQRLAEELQASRERLVSAREEERRRIRRDLHDGLGPALSGIVFRLESARLLLERDPAGVAAQLAETVADVRDVVADVRRLVHDLRPPALDDLGLAGALRQQADRLARSGVAVSVAGEVGPVSAAVEVAAYRIVAEALTNAARHAEASRVDVTLSESDGALALAVRDDGVGIAPDAEAGIGLVSLRERAAEVGGRTEVTCPPGGGTLVRAWLPVPREEIR